MFFGLFREKVKLVKVKRKSKPKKTTKVAKRTKAKKAKITKRAAGPKKRKAAPQILGKVTHYFPHVKAGVVLVSKGKLSLGDTVYIKGQTTDFKQKVASMQINNAPIKEAKPGQEIGLLVKSRVRHNDVVYKV